jgi:Tol biopolymer transport system component
MRRHPLESRVVLALITVVACASVPARAASPTASETAIVTREPWIVYQGGDTPGGITPLHLVRLDGSDDHVLALDELPGDDVGHPAWSPDGERIAFDLFEQVADSPDRVSVWVVGTDGSAATQVATCDLPCLQLAYPAWSPDGTEIALVRYDYETDGTWGPSAVEVLDLATGERRVLTETPAPVAVFTPRWSPDGSAIVFVIETYADATEEAALSSVIATIPTDGSTTTPTVLTGTDVVAGEPDWGPGQRIAFARFDSFDARPDSGTIVTMEPDGSDLQVFGAADSGLPFAIEPSWTPDGRLLVGIGDLATGTQWLAWMDPQTGAAERLPWDLFTAVPGVQRAHHHLQPGN